MKIKTLLITAALATVTALTTNAEEVTATWALGTKTPTCATSAESITGEYAYSAGIDQVGTADATNADGTETYFTATTWRVMKTADNNETKYVDFIIKPNGVSFAPTSISFDAAQFATGNMRYSIDLIGKDGVKVSVATEETPIRADNKGTANATNCHKEFKNLKFAADDEIVTVRFTIWETTGGTKKIGLANLVITGNTYANGEEPIIPEVPEIPEGAVIAPLAFGTMYDLTKAEHNNIATVGPNDIGNTFKGTSVDFPFYLENDATIFFYLEQGAAHSSGGYLNVSLDGEKIGEHEVVITGSWSNYEAVSVFRLDNLSAGKHVVTVTRDDERCTESYAGNWRVSLHAEDVYDFASINLEAGKYTGGIRSENNNSNVGNIKDGATAEYRIYVPQSGNYVLNLGIKNYGGGTCKVTIKEEGIETSFDTTPVSRSYSDTRRIALGDINNPGVKTLRMEFTASPGNTGYIANYDNLGLERTGDVSGIADVEAAEVVAVEYYNLQGVRVEGGARGTLIRVSTDANGSRKAEKVIVR